MNECIDSRRWLIVRITLALLLVLGASALVRALAPDPSLGLGMAILGGLAILLFAFAASVPAAGKYVFGPAEQRVAAGNAPVFCLMLAVVWVVPGLLGYFGIVPEETVFPLAFAAFWLVGVPVLGWHHGLVVDARRRDRDRAAEIAPTAPAVPAGAVALESTSAGPAKGLAVSLLVYWWSLIPGAAAGILILLSAMQISGELERKQLLEITNTGSRPVNVGELTIHPGGKYLHSLPDKAPIVVDGKERAIFHHKPRTAEVEKTSSAEIEFRFTDE